MLFNIVSRLIVTLFFGIVILSAPVRADAAEAVHVSPALWQVKKGEGSVYLLGSFHLLPENYKWYDGIIQQSFESSQELVMEAKMTPESTAGIQAMVINNAFFAGDDNLKNYLDSAHYEKMLEYAKSLMGMDEVAVKKMKPWFVGLQMSVISIMSSGMDPALGVDKQLEGLAEKGSKTISGLETPQQSMNALIKHPLNVQSAMLTDTLDKLDDFETYVNSYLDAWASGEAEVMSKIMTEDMATHQDMYQALLVDRNNNWLPAIEGYINGGKNIFIVVGAAHLVGPDGLVRMLESKGYKLDKIQ